MTEDKPQEIMDIENAIIRFIDAEKQLGAGKNSIKTGIKNIVRDAMKKSFDYYDKVEGRKRDCL